MSSDYKTVLKSASDEFVEKRSRFIGYCKPVQTEAQATDFISEIRAMHRGAKHNVYAYSLLCDNIKRFTDDGEPSQTAGLPCLDVITKNKIFDVCVVVTRYFGGVLLGTGGLVRAYSRAAKIALAASEVVTMQRCFDCRVSCSYNLYGKAAAVIGGLGAVIDDAVFESRVTVKFHIKPELFERLNRELANITSGTVTAVSDGEAFFAVPCDFSV